MLATHGTRPVPREELYANVWNGPAEVGRNALYTTVSRLNRKLEDAGTSLAVVFNGSEGYTLERI